MPMSGVPQGSASLPASFYDRPVLAVARDLVGCVLRLGEIAGVIVETEAYHDSEPACHAYAGLTPRTKTLFGPPGHAYVYRSYGIHSLFNAVCEREGVGAAVLIRALQPLSGIEQMQARRGTAAEVALCSGPGKLSQALGVELSHDGSKLCGGPIAITAPLPGWEQAELRSAPRVGITKAIDLPWRFCLAGNPHVSVPRPR